VWINADLSQDNADRWIFHGGYSTRGVLLEAIGELREWVPKSSLGRSGSEATPNWVYASLEMPLKQIDKFLRAHGIETKGSRLQPLTGDSWGWRKVFPD
jgi:hypothetical protein